GGGDKEPVAAHGAPPHRDGRSTSAPTRAPPTHCNPDLAAFLAANRSGLPMLFSLGSDALTVEALAQQLQVIGIDLIGHIGLHLDRIQLRNRSHPSVFARLSDEVGAFS